MDLKQARTNAELSRLKVSRLIGVSIKTLQRWENGDSEPSLGEFKKLSEIYNLSEPQKLLFLNTDTAVNL